MLARTLQVLCPINLHASINSSLQFDIHAEKDASRMMCVTLNIL